MLLYKHTGWLFYIVLLMGFNTEILFNWNWWSGDLWIRLRGDSRIKLKQPLVSWLTWILHTWNVVYCAAGCLTWQSSWPNRLTLWSDPCKFPWLLLMSNEKASFHTEFILKYFPNYNFPMFFEVVRSHLNNRLYLTNRYMMEIMMRFPDKRHTCMNLTADWMTDWLSIHQRMWHRSIERKLKPIVP